MGWKILPALFWTKTKTISDMENSSLQARTHAWPHKLKSCVEAVAKYPKPAPRPNLAAL